MKYFKIFLIALKRLIRESMLNDPIYAVDYYRKKGVQIGNNVRIYNTNIDARRPFLVSIGNNVTITGSRLLTHDASMYQSLGYTKVGRIDIGDDVFIGIGTIILPNVKIGNRVIIGAGTIVSKDIPDNSVVTGNPQQVICSYDDFIARHEKNIEQCPKFINKKSFKQKEIKDMRDALAGRVGYSKIIHRG